MQEYSSGFTADRLYKKELITILTLRQQGLTDQEIRDKIISENPFQLRSERGIKATLQRVYRRLRVLDDTLCEFMLNGTRFDQQALVLYSFLQAYRFPREFVAEVIRYTYVYEQNHITDQTIRAFFERKEQESETVNNWSKQTKRKLREIMLLYFTECELLIHQDDRYQITPIPMSKSLREYATEYVPPLLFLTLNDAQKG